MMKHVLRLHIVGRWKRLLLIFLLSGAAVSVFPPVYFPISAVPSLLDWLLEVSGSLLVIAFLPGCLLHCYVSIRHNGYGRRLERPHWLVFLNAVHFFGPILRLEHLLPPMLLSY